MRLPVRRMVSALHTRAARGALPLEGGGIHMPLLRYLPHTDLGSWNRRTSSVTETVRARRVRMLVADFHRICSLIWVFLAGPSPKAAPDFHTTPRPAGIHSTEVREPGFTPRDHRGQKRQWDPRRAGGDRSPRHPKPGPRATAQLV